MKLIIGLGNPGKEYVHTRHNIGFDVIDTIISELGILTSQSKFQGIIYEKIINGEKILFLKPETFMNLSGNSVIEVINFYKIDAKNDVIVIYDDMDLPLGHLRFRYKGSAGGHNGVKSIISHIGQEFKRIRCGIGHSKGNEIEFVLGRFSIEDRKIVDSMIKQAVEAIKLYFEDFNFENVMQKFN